MKPQDSLCVVSVDIGTSGAKALLAAGSGAVLGEARESYPIRCPAPGRAEQDAEEVAGAVLRAIGRLMEESRIEAARVAAVVFCGIWQSLLPVDAAGCPLAPAMIWADRRSALQNERLRRQIDPQWARSRSGCSLHPMYHPSRITWLREELPELYGRTARFVSIKEYVLEELFGVTVGDRSTASGTGLWNAAARDWDPELLRALELPRAKLPDLVEPTTLSGALRAAHAAATGLRAGTPAIVGGADGAHAHLGCAGLSPGRFSLSFGTSAALRAWAPQPHITPSSESWCYYLAEDNWLLGGVVHDAGNSLRWLIENLLPASGSEERDFAALESMVRSIPSGSEGLRFLPYLAGERSPHYRPEATGTLTGLTFGHSRAHIARSLMEGLAYNLYSVYRALEGELRGQKRNEARREHPSIVATGGALRCPALLQIIADLFGERLYRAPVPEAAAWGGVLLALRALGIVASLGEGARLVEPLEGAAPSDSALVHRNKLIASYDELYERLYGNQPRP